jgi:uncharacterized membrane protein (UPF0127 family)
MSNKLCICLVLSVLLSNCGSDDTLPMVTISINKHIFMVEVASTHEQRTKGLMFTKELKENHGMLFVFPAEQYLSFYMKNTYIPLSLAYISSDGKILQIVDLKPLDETPVYSKAQARYALELPRGTFESLNIHTGDTVTLPDNLS